MTSGDDPRNAIPPGLAPHDGSSRGSRLRALLGAPGATIAPGVYDALGARLVEQVGFDVCYLTGAGVANAQFGFPDVGLVTLTEMVDCARRVMDATALPVIVDADTGHGGPLSVMRSVRLFERAGAAGIQIEDQAMPKRCGHFAGKRIVDTEEMVTRIEAARMARSDPSLVIIARTDARAVEGFDAAVERARQYARAGADAIFVEAPETVEELALIPRRVTGVPLVVNIVEGGLTPQVPASELESFGYRLIIHANALLRLMIKAGQAGLTHLHQTGETASLAEVMLSWSERQEIVNLVDFQAIEDAITGRSRRFVAGPDGSDPAGTSKAAAHADPADQGEPAGTVGPTARGRQ